MSIDYSIAAPDDFSGLSIKDFLGNWINVSKNNIKYLTIKYCNLFCKIFPMLEPCSLDELWVKHMYNNPENEHGVGCSVVLWSKYAKKEIVLNNKVYRPQGLSLSIEVDFNYVYFNSVFVLSDKMYPKHLKLYKYVFSDEHIERSFFNEDFDSDYLELNDAFRLFKELCVK